MRWLACIALIACSDPRPERPERVVTPPPAASAPVVAPLAPPRRAPAVVAPPSGILDTLAVSADGTAALTIDSGGGVRLWPTLDGTREPIVVFGLRAAAIALGHDAEGYVIAELDVTGTLEIYRYSPAGEQISRVQVVSDHPFDQIEVTPRGILALRTDDVIELYAPWGTREGRISPPPGERIATLLQRGDARTTRALALTTMPSPSAGAPTLRGRWVELDGTPRWGAATPPLAIEPSTAALSPDHTRLVARAQPGDRVVVVELATGTATPLGDKRHAPIAFATADTVLVKRAGVLEWWSLAGASRVVARAAPEGPTAVPASGVVAGRVIGLLGEQLVLFAGNDPRRHLGYQVRDLGRVRESPIGLVADTSDFRTLPSAPIVIDAALAVHGRVRLPARDGIRWIDQIPIDDRRVLALGASADDSRWITLVDTTTGDDHALGTGDVYDDTLRYDHATRTVSAIGIAQVMFARIDSTGARIVEPSHLAIEEPTSLATHFVDRVRTGGTDAIVIDQLADEFRAYEVAMGEPGTWLVARRTRTLRGIAVAVDRAGRIYALEPDGGLAIHGRERVRVAESGIHRVVPRPDATGFLALGANRITAYDPAGQIAWTIPAITTNEAWWLPDGGLVLEGGGLVRLDPATGRRLEQRCGWRFGLHETSVVIGGQVALACDVAPLDAGQ